MVGLPTGKEALTKRWRTKDKFSDLIYSSDYNQYGQGTPLYGEDRQAFAGYDPDTLAPTFVTAPTGTETLGEKQALIEFKKTVQEEKAKDIQKEYNKKIQEEYTKDINKYADKSVAQYQKLVNEGNIKPEEANKLLNQDIDNYGKSILNSTKYKGFEDKAIKSLEKIKMPKNLENLYIQDLSSRTRRILGYVPVVGSGIQAVESARELSKQQAGLVGFETAMGLGTGSQKGVRKALGKTAFDVGMFGLDVAMVAGLGKAGVQLTRTAIKKELAKRTSIGLEQLGKAKITGVNVIKEGGEFYMIGKQQTGNFFAPFKIKGILVKKGSSLSFIPEAKGFRTISGISEINFKGISGKTKKLIAKIIKEPTFEQYRAIQSFDLSGVGVSREIPIKIRGLTPSRTAGIGVYSPKAETYGIIREGTKKSLKQQFAENIRRGGDPFVSQLVSPQFAGTIQGRKAALEISKKSEILSLLYDKPKVTKIISQGKKYKKVTGVIDLKPKPFDLVDDLFVKPKPILKPTPTGNGRQILLQKEELLKLQQQQLPFTDFLQESFAKTTRAPFLQPFAFKVARTTGVDAVTRLAVGLGVKTALTPAVRTAITRQGVRQDVLTGQRTISRQLTGQKQISRQVSKKVTKSATTGVSNIVQGLTGPTIGGVGGFVIRPIGFPIIPKFSRPGAGRGRRYVAPKKKKKGKFELEITGFQAITGKKVKRRKKLSQITGFELLR
jgi:hypothetical protein